MFKAQTIFLLAISSLGSIALSAPTFPMECRGGGSMTAEIVIQNPSSGVIVTFQKSPRAAREGLAPGQCAWFDRALLPTEPTSFCHSDINGRIRFSGNQVLLTNSAKAPYLNDLRDSSRTFIVQVYTESSSCLRVTKVGL